MQGDFLMMSLHTFPSGVMFEVKVTTAVKSCIKAAACALFDFSGRLLYETGLYSRQAYVQQLCNY